MPGEFIGFAANGDVLDEILELDRAGMFGNNNGIIRIPLIEHLSFLYCFSILNEDSRAIRNIEFADNAIIVIEDINKSRTRKHQRFAFFVLDNFHSFILDRTVELRRDL